MLQKLFSLGLFNQTRKSFEVANPVVLATTHWQLLIIEMRFCEFITSNFHFYQWIIHKETFFRKKSLPKKQFSLYVVVRQNQEERSNLS